MSQSKSVKVEARSRFWLCEWQLCSFERLRACIYRCASAPAQSQGSSTQSFCLASSNGSMVFAAAACRWWRCWRLMRWQSEFVLLQRSDTQTAGQSMLSKRMRGWMMTLWVTALPTLSVQREEPMIGRTSTLHSALSRTLWEERGDRQNKSETYKRSFKNRNWTKNHVWNNKLKNKQSDGCEAIVMRFNDWLIDWLV